LIREAIGVQVDWCPLGGLGLNTHDSNLIRQAIRVWVNGLLLRALILHAIN
jgi:hypothetical protein